MDVARLNAPLRQPDIQFVEVAPHHRFPKILADLANQLSIFVVGGRFNNGFGAFGRVAAFEDAAANKYAVASHLHHECCVGWCGDAACCEVDDGEAAHLFDFAEDVADVGGQLFVGDAAVGVVEGGFFAAEVLKDEFVEGVVAFGVVFGHAVQFVVFGGLDELDGAGHHAAVAYGFDDVAASCFAFGADHGGAFGDAPHSFAEVGAAADEGYGEVFFEDVEEGVGGGEDFGFVDHVDAEFLEDLGFGEVADAAFGHDGNGDAVDDGFDHFGVAHAAHTALGADVGGDAFEGHDGDGSGVFGDGGLFVVGDVHDDAAFLHLGKSAFDQIGSPAERFQVQFPAHGAAEGGVGYEVDPVVWGFLWMRFGGCRLRNPELRGGCYVGVCRMWF